MKRTCSKLINKVLSKIDRFKYSPHFTLNGEYKISSKISQIMTFVFLIVLTANISEHF